MLEGIRKFVTARAVSSTPVATG